MNDLNTRGKVCNTLVAFVNYVVVGLSMISVGGGFFKKVYWRKRQCHSPQTGTKVFNTRIKYSFVKQVEYSVRFSAGGRAG